MAEASIELVKMSGKGQLVVPQDIRQSANLNPGERFVAFAIEEGVLFKKIELPKVEFENVTKEIEKQFKKNNVKKNDIAGAIKWARKK